MAFDIKGPIKEYECLLGFHRPHALSWSVSTKYSEQDGSIEASSVAIGIGRVSGITDSNCTALLITRYFTQGAKVLISRNGSFYQALSIAFTELPHLLLMPAGCTIIGFNIPHTDMGYIQGQYDLNTSFNQKFINTFGVFPMYESNPHYSKLELTKSKTDDEIFMRREISTDLAFYAQDYRTVLSHMPVAHTCIGAIAFIELNRAIQGVNLCFAAKFNLADCTIDKARECITPKLKALDNYTDFLEKYETTLNITRIGSKLSYLRFNAPPILQVYVLGSNKLTSICDGEVWEQEVNTVIDILFDNEHPDSEQMAHYLVGNSNNKYSSGWYQVNSDNLPTPTTAPSMQEMRAIVITNSSLLNFRGTYYYDSQTDKYFNADSGAEIVYDSSNQVATFWYGGLQSSFNPQQWPLADNENITSSGIYSCSGYSVYLWLGYSQPIGSSSMPRYGGVFARILVADKRDTGFMPGNSNLRILDEQGHFCTLPPFYNSFLYDSNISDNLIISARQLYGLEDENLGLHDITNGICHYFKRPSFFSLTPTEFKWQALPLNQTLWGDTSYWVRLKSGHPLFKDSISITKTIKDSFTLTDLLQSMLNYQGIPIKYDTALDSLLLSGQSAQDLSGLPIDDLVITPASNILRGPYTQAAQVGDCSIKELLDDICKRLNAYWYIDAGHLHIEGTEYFYGNKTYDAPDLSTVDIDFERLTDEFNDTQITYGQRTAQGDTKKAWSNLALNGDAVTSQFIETSVISAANFNIDKDITQKLIYDLLGCLIRPDKFAESGLIVLACIKNEQSGNNNFTYYSCSRIYLGISDNKPFETGTAQDYAIPVSNYPLSWSRLKARLQFDKPASIRYWNMCIANASSYTAKSYMTSYYSTEIRLPISSQLNLEQSAFFTCKTPLGYGILAQVKTDLITRVSTLTINLYNLIS